MKNKGTIKPLILLLLAIALAACAIVPIPYYIEAPGSTIDLKELITVDDQKDTLPGSFSLTSVGVRQATVFSLIYAKFQDFTDIVSEEEMLGGATDEEYDQIQQYYMETSQNNAIQQALKLADRKYSMEYKGVYVLSVDPASAFYHQIGVGDTVTEANGKTFKSSEEFMKYVQGQTVGDQMKVTYLHGGKEKVATGKLMKLSTGKPGIGITLTDRTEIATDENIKFHVENIGGPSAGLMFTLEIYEQLTQQNLRQGKHIAGTGTIDSEGKIGRIGGIDKKVASADQNDIEIFFAPDDELPKDSKEKTNYEEAKAAAEKIGTKMKIIPVKTVQDALDYLKKMK